MRMNVEKSKSGLNCLWEQGGGSSNTGEATIITDKNAGRKKAIYVRRRGELCNSQHALIPVVVGDYVITTSHHRNDHRTTIYQIVDIRDGEAILEDKYFFSDGEWDVNPSALFDNALKAVIDKSEDYHCRTPYYIYE